MPGFVLLLNNDDDPDAEHQRAQRGQNQRKDKAGSAKKEEGQAAKEYQPAPYRPPPDAAPPDVDYAWPPLHMASLPPLPLATYYA
jgi:hypothetical protein